jgi:uncharacterized RDD family membrane protein YckC
MSIAVQCSGCGGKFRAPDEAAGKWVKCPKCATLIQVGNVIQQRTVAASKPIETPAQTSPPQIPSVAHKPADNPLPFVRTDQSQGSAAGIQVVCACGKKLVVQPEFAHGSLVCPYCRRTFTLPQAQPASAHPGPVYATTQQPPAQQSLGYPKTNVCPRCRTDTGRKPLRPIYDGYICRKCRRSLINRRAGAWILDMIFFLIGSVVAGLLLGALLAAVGARDTDSVQSASGLVSLLVCILYLTKDGWLEGKSLGKAICGIKVVTRGTLRPIGMGASFKRNLPLMIPGLPLLAAIQINLEDCQRIGEGWANTMVTFAYTRP